MTEQKEVKSLMEEYKWYDVGETRYAVIEKKNIGEFMVRCERDNWEVKDIRMSDEFVENMDEYFGVRMDMEFIRIGKEHSSDYEKQRTAEQKETQSGEKENEHEGKNSENKEKEITEKQQEKGSNSALKENENKGKKIVEKEQNSQGAEVVEKKPRQKQEKEKESTLKEREKAGKEQAKEQNQEKGKDGMQKGKETTGKELKAQGRETADKEPKRQEKEKERRESKKREREKPREEKKEEATSKTSGNDLIFVAGDFNGHVGQEAGIFTGVHGGCGIGTRNDEGTRLLEFCDACNLLICNTNFRKPDSHLVTYQSGDSSS
ncbi:Hypothetical predicted protein [Octopus vulgaris]|uniref:Uncharacterized protein n=1 Tax=Octopus vulgaris TaxID=6645 RepID=A0AA36BV70_OCTVU|nr:Hypothetical predicted protein [Octopus vulgaris]